MPQKVTRQVVELTIKPIPPDTIASVKAELLPYIRSILKEQGKDNLLTDGEIVIEVEKTFPTDEIVVIGLTLLSQVALETFKTLILPKLKKRFETRQKRRKGKSRK